MLSGTLASALPSSRDDEYENSGDDNDGGDGDDGGDGGGVVGDGGDGQQ